jgi:hypothetical protein
MKIKVFTAFLLISFVCYGQSSEVDFNKYFSETEIKDLNTITDFFQNELCGNSNRREFGSCIRKLVPDIIDFENNFIEKKINYRRQKKLYNQISKNTFDKIWSLNKSWRLEEPKYEYETLSFSGNTEFIQFVLDLGKTNGFLSKYGQELRAVGGFDNGNYIASNIIEFLESINIEDRGVQILFAIHYLSENDNRKRDKKAIRLEKRDLIKMNRNLRRKNKNNTVPNTVYN